MLDTAVRTFTVTRSMPRHVRCEHCNQEYVYRLTRTGMGESGYGLSDDQATADVKAANAALADLWREIDTGADAVPCPWCYKYQAHMTAAARAIQWGWIRGLGTQGLAWSPLIVIGAILVATLASPNNTDAAVTAALATTGVILLAAAIGAVAFRLSPCEPNRWSESYRVQQAGALALPRADFGVANREGGPYAADFVAGQEAEYANASFLWVLPEEIASETTVSLHLGEQTEVRVELSDADDEGVFLGADRIRNGPPDCRVCLRLFSVYRPGNAASNRDSQ